MDACLLALAVWLAWPTQGYLTNGARGRLTSSQHVQAGRTVSWSYGFDAQGRG